MNLIVIVSDTFRYDYLGANGNTWIKTPELDAFSRIAVNFDRCTISSFPTIPTRTDWFTGRYGFPFHGWQPLDPKATVLAGELAKAGSVNQLITDCPHLMSGTNHFQRGFHGFDWICDWRRIDCSHWCSQSYAISRSRRKSRPTTWARPTERGRGMRR